VELKFIGDRFSILGTIITPSGKMRAKMTKIGKKIRKKLHKNRVLFLYIIRIYSLKICASGGGSQ